MLERANRNKEKTCADNISFIESAITEVALPDGIADCIISNCVVNLVPEQQKQLAFNEMFRLLKPGGRVAMSDILLKKELPNELKKSMALYVGCIAGASLVKDYEEYLREAGFGGNDWFPVQSIIHFESLMLILS
jgi:arsenite methyltransferase